MIARLGSSLFGLPRYVCAAFLSMMAWIDVGATTAMRSAGVIDVSDVMLGFVTSHRSASSREDRSFQPTPFDQPRTNGATPPAPTSMFPETIPVSIADPELSASHFTVT